jgi:hypothetical protein
MTANKRTPKKNGELLREGESKEQILFVQWLRRNHAKHLVFAIPNGGQRNKVTAVRLKAEGVTRGVPDLMIPSLALWVEMKTKGGRVSPHQTEWIDHLRGCGYVVLVCWSFEDAKRAFLDHLDNFGGRMIY